MKIFRTGILILIIFLFVSMAFAQDEKFLGRKQIHNKHVFKEVSDKKAKYLNRLDEKNTLSLNLSLPLRNEAELKDFIKQLSDPNSPNYRKYLSVEEFTARYGPTEEDYQKVADFAKANGLKIKKKHINRMLLDVEGKVKDVEKAFGITIGEYKHPTEARVFYSPDIEPTTDLPFELSYVAGLSNFSMVKPMHSRKKEKVESSKKSMATLAGDIKKAIETEGAAPAADCTGTCTGSGPTGWFIGSDFRKTFYGTGSLTGAGQSVALVQFAPYDPSDVDLYFSTVGETRTVPIVNVSVGGAATTCTNPGCSEAAAEVVLDINWAISMAPGLSSVRVYVAENNTNNFLPMLNAIATDNISKQISISWGGPVTSTTFCDNVFAQLAAQGQSVFAASGDWAAWHAPSSSATTTTINTTGATFIIATISTLLTPQIDGGFIDSKGNTWTRIPGWDNNEPFSGYLGFYYSFPTSVGSDHTFTYSTSTGNSDGITISVIAFTGSYSSSTYIPGSNFANYVDDSNTIQPSTGAGFSASNNQLCVTGWSSGSFGVEGAPTINQSFVLSPLSHYQQTGYNILHNIDMAYKNITTSEYVNPTWTAVEPVPGSQYNNANMACFSTTVTPSVVGYATGFRSFSITSGFFPAESPYITTVGGTSLVTGTDQVWSSETTWSAVANINSSTGYYGGGGGISLYHYAIPDYQQTTGVITVGNKGSNTYRNAPDISGPSDFKNYTCVNGVCNGGWCGTSFAAPMWAGFMALINQQSLINGNGVIGFANPVFYSIGLGANYSTGFHDITTGSIAPDTHPNEWDAGTGFDLATGWGSPKVGLITLMASGANITNGACGSSNGGSFSSAPSTNLCTSGTTGTVSLSSGTYSWSCLGSGGGTTASCSATYTGGTDTTAPTVTISTSSPQTIYSNSLTVTGTASDAVGVTGCKFRVGLEPDSSNGTACTGTTSWSCSTSGYSMGANTLYIECYDAIPNYSTGHSITVNYALSQPTSVKSGGKLSGGVMR